jgi:ABC-type branched-subunit amino acid transport system substrate-binding protein
MGLLSILGLTLSSAASAQTAKIAVVTSLTGSGQFAGRTQIDAVRFAVEEANAAGASPPLELAIYDDHSTEDGARQVAKEIVASDALAVVGPSLTVLSLAVGPIYADAGIVSVVPTAHGDRITDAPTSFRTVFSTGEIGEALANYLHYALGGDRAVVVYKDNGYGRPFADGFKRVGARLGIAAEYFAFTNDAQMEEATRVAAAAADQPALLLGMTYEDAVPVMIALRRQDARGLILGTATMARAGFADLFKDQPEERKTPGYFTRGVYAASSMILDSANADMLAFAERYRARYGKEPSWEAAQSYDALNLVAAGIHAALAGGAADLQMRRAAIKGYLASLDSPANAVAGVTGPIWFTPTRGRQQAVRVGRFHGMLFESAPLQLVPVSNPTEVEIASGAIVETGPGVFARRQQVVYTGVFLNEISRLDISQSTFTADFYLWLRFASGAGAGAAEPTDIDFPDLVRGNFDAKRPAAEGNLDDGTTYRLWRIRGDFKNDFDLHHYPYDRQKLVMRLFNARAASDRVVYVQDRRSIDEGAGLPPTALVSPSSSGGAFASPVAPASTGAPAEGKSGGTVAPAAFRNLTQWEPLRADQLRDVLVTESALGDPRLVGVERVRELSGYRVELDLRRRTIATLAKTLLPLMIMTLIMLASLYFPHALVKEKVTIVITGALSGAVLLSAVNSQLGAVGYTMAVEYVFYVFFTLCLLCTVSVLTAERLRVAGKANLAVRTEIFTRALYLTAVVATIIAAWVVTAQW